MSHRVKERKEHFILKKILLFLSLTLCKTALLAKFIKKEHVPKDFDKEKFKID
jgi:hypothetical protein